MFNFNLKFILAGIYLLIIILFFYLFFNILNFDSIDDVSFVLINQKINYFVGNNYFIILFSYFIFAFIWVFILGFISPILLIAGYILGPLQGAIIVSLSNALAGTLLVFIIKNYFMREIKKFLPKKIEKIALILNNDVNFYFLIFRLLGGFGTPSQIQNVLPSLINIKYFNYLIISIIGCMPIMYITTSIGHSLKYISEFDKINTSILSEPKVISFIIVVILFLIVTKFLKKKINL